VPTLVHLSDIHFGRDVDLEQIAAIEALVPEEAPTAIVISGDVSQRSRHGELIAARRFVDGLRRTAPTLVIPGNHDVEWWRSPLGVLGRRRPHAKYRAYFGDILAPTLGLPGLVVASALTSHGVTWGSLSWKVWRDTAVKGHLPRAEIERAAAVFAGAPAGALRVLAVHHNVLRGEISGRMGLVRWRTAQRRIADSGAELVLCGHDHQQGAALLLDRVVVSSTGTHTSRSRGGHPSAFNIVRATSDTIAVQHFVWAREAGRFRPEEPRVYRRHTRAPAEAAPAAPPTTALR
jgi:3',5'-cyclic AMP phosphodiesterase CpdA